MKTSLLFEAARHRAAQLRAERFAGCVILFYAPDGDGVSFRSFPLSVYHVRQWTTIYHLHESAAIAYSNLPERFFRRIHLCAACPHAAVFAAVV